MKAKYAIIIFLVGFLITLFGAWLKITHFSFGPFNGNICLTIGSVIQGLGILLIIFKVLTNQRFKDFLNK
ncbi:gliding motility protein GldL [Chryseobacterium sp. PBS4-4]|uniref:Gliding motility protein GldL n=1 Tax=Chryseobacterium edaphi TaxID=2976532 RepID=A0ABT2W5N4_9FLAO|nr:gliding motility protein GldL [Chryseobacterium edaphi]MCU7616714.1 gliding motility protein GldL [Chryseobacterium edaphi]